MADLGGGGGGSEEGEGKDDEARDDADHGDDHEASPPVAIHEAHAEYGAHGIEAGGDEREGHGGLVGRESGELDYGGAVVHDCVDAHKLLSHLHGYARVQPPPHGVVLPGAPELPDDPAVGSGAPVQVEGGSQGGQLLLHFLGGIYPLHDGLGLFLLAVLEKPSGRLGEREHEDELDDSRNTGNAEHPAPVSSDIGKG